MGVRFMQFIPIVERVTETLLPLANLGWGTERGDDRPLYLQTGHHITDRSVEPEAFGRFLTSIFDEWIHNDVGEVYVQHFDVALAQKVRHHAHRRVDVVEEDLARSATEQRRPRSDAAPRVRSG